MNSCSVFTQGVFRPLVVVLPLILPVSIFAQEPAGYLGLSGGRSYADINRNALTSSLQRGGYSISQLRSEEIDYNFKILAGYKFNSNFALEASYFDLGKFDFSTALLPAANQLGEASGLRGVALDLVGSVPLRDRLSAFARVGVNNTKVKQEFSGNTVGTGFSNRSDRGWNEKYGIGLQYAVNDLFSLRSELERYRIEDNGILRDSVDTFTIGAVFHFGSRRQTVPAEQRAEPPVPVPTRAPQPAPALPIELTLTADTHFDFDRTELKAEGRQALDRLVDDMRSVDYDVVLVTGHTDRIGTRSYNLGLSERRAEVVKNYLVSAGIADTRITTRGVNSDEPVTRPDQCRNTGSAQAQIACLQPDRRVVVLVTGTTESD